MNLQQLLSFYFWILRFHVFKALVAQNRPYSRTVCATVHQRVLGHRQTLIDSIFRPQIMRKSDLSHCRLLQFVRLLIKNFNTTVINFLALFGYRSREYTLVVLRVKNLFTTFWLETWSLSVPALLTDIVFTFGHWSCFLVSLEGTCASQRLTYDWKRLLVRWLLFGSWFSRLTFFTVITKFGCYRGSFLVEIRGWYVFETTKVELGFVFFANVLTHASFFYVDFWKPIFAGPFFY